jgi:hypothetical protein
MPLITRTAKGSKLTIAEMDGNLTYLEQLAQSDGLEYITEDTTVGNENLEISVTDGTNSSEIKVEPTAISSQVFQDAQNRVSLELGVSTSLFGLKNGDLISGLELDPAENNNGTRLYTEDADSGDKTELYLLGYEINLGNNSVSNNSDGSLNLNRFSVDLRFTSGDLSSALELDPAENNFGTRLFTEDTDTNDKSEIKLTPTEITIDTINLFLPTIPEYVDNATAISSGATTNQVYKTSTGELRIVV